jgi:hypothetical protein
VDHRLSNEGPLGEWPFLSPLWAQKQKGWRDGKSDAYWLSNVQVCSTLLACLWVVCRRARAPWEPAVISDPGLSISFFVYHRVPIAVINQHGRYGRCHISDAVGVLCRIKSLCRDGNVKKVQGEGKRIAANEERQWAHWRDLKGNVVQRSYSVLCVLNAMPHQPITQLCRVNTTSHFNLVWDVSLVWLFNAHALCWMQCHVSPLPSCAGLIQCCILILSEISY